MVFLRELISFFFEVWRDQNWEGVLFYRVHLKFLVSFVEFKLFAEFGAETEFVNEV